MPDFLGFFAGRRFVPIMTVVVTLLICIPLYFVWPVVYTFLVSVGEGILGMGAIGAGIYGFLNRLLIPVGLHHALNSVFWLSLIHISSLMVMGFAVWHPMGRMIFETTALNTEQMKLIDVYKRQVLFSTLTSSISALSPA